jgi:hypothetical protein
MSGMFRFVGPLFLFLFSLTAKAAVIESNTVHSFQEIHSILNRLLTKSQIEPEEILVVSDWDDVVVNEGSSQAGQLRDSSSKEFFDLITSQRIPFFVLTARLDEIKRTEESITVFENMSRGMLQVLPEVDFYSHSETAFLNYFPHLFGEMNAAYANGVVFSAKKGEALAAILDQNKLKTQPRVILFTDDRSDHIQQMKDSFANREEGIILCHYPAEDRQLEIFNQIQNGNAYSKNKKKKYVSILGWQ